MSKTAGLPEPARARPRPKWEPVAAMLVLLAVSLWVVYRPEPVAGRTEPVRIANSRGVIVETIDVMSGEPRYQLVLRDGHASPHWTRTSLERDFGVEVAKAFTAARPNWAFRVCNVTSWTSFLWLVLGLVGQGAFSARMLIQWAVSEKKKQSTVPPLFWWLSLLGAMALFAYFTWRQDLVGVLGQAPGVVIYARNLRLIAKARRRALREPLGARA